jgi:hypothetical protein
MRIFELDSEKLEYLRTPALLSSLAAAGTYSSIPPLNSLSATSDDSSSVSSVSIDDNWEESSKASQGSGQKRSIFSSYWNKKGGRPEPLYEGPLSEITEDLTIDSSDSESSIDSSLADNSYEKLLLKKEAVATEPRSCGRRRRIWGNNVHIPQSEPSLPTCVAEKPSCLRKTKSSSTVRRPSILRESRYSGSRQPGRRASEGTIVSFSEEVRVEYLKPVTENYAAKGWSKYFM